MPPCDLDTLGARRQSKACCLVLRLGTGRISQQDYHMIDRAGLVVEFAEPRPPKAAKRRGLMPVFQRTGSCLAQDL